MVELGERIDDGWIEVLTGLVGDRGDDSGIGPASLSGRAWGVHEDTPIGFAVAVDAAGPVVSRIRSLVSSG